MASSNWICCQLGAREHYSIPRMLHQSGQLTALITDAWVSPHSAIVSLPIPALKNLCDRYHRDLANAPVTAFTRSLIQFELKQRLQQKSPTDWNYMMARNHWFQKRAVQTLAKLRSKIEANACSPVLFTYSYAALDLLRFAKQAGWKTVLGQMDPGIMEEKIVVQEYKKYPDLASACQPIPADYWQAWQEECELADRIVVNSDWSKQLLQQTGISPSKIETVPLVYQPPSAAAQFERSYPEKFSRDRPLKILFLGLVTLRKGIGVLLEAIKHLAGIPIELQIVGPLHIEVPEAIQSHRQIRWIGPVPRSQVAQCYQRADVFIFPTVSDGFGLTQLEAQAWKLPIIASSHCGQVVKHQQNGLLLPEISAEAIAQAITYCYQHPEAIAAYSNQAISSNQFQLSDLSQRFNNLAHSTLNLVP